MLTSTLLQTLSTQAAGLVQPLQLVRMQTVLTHQGPQADTVLRETSQLAFGLDRLDRRLRQHGIRPPTECCQLRELLHGLVGHMLPSDQAIVLNGQIVHGTDSALEPDSLQNIATSLGSLHAWLQVGAALFAEGLQTHEEKRNEIQAVWKQILQDTGLNPNSLLVRFYQYTDDKQLQELMRWLEYKPDFRIWFLYSVDASSPNDDLLLEWIQHGYNRAEAWQAMQINNDSDGLSYLVSKGNGLNQPDDILQYVLSRLCASDNKSTNIAALRQVLASRIELFLASLRAGSEQRNIDFCNVALNQIRFFRVVVMSGLADALGDQLRTIVTPLTTMLPVLSAATAESSDPAVNTPLTICIQQLSILFEDLGEKATVMRLEQLLGEETQLALVSRDEPLPLEEQAATNTRLASELLMKEVRMCRSMMDGSSELEGKHDLLLKWALNKALKTGDRKIIDQCLALYRSDAEASKVTDPSRFLGLVISLIQQDAQECHAIALLYFQRIFKFPELHIRLRAIQVLFSNEHAVQLCKLLRVPMRDVLEKIVRLPKDEQVTLGKQYKKLISTTPDVKRRQYPEVLAAQLLDQVDPGWDSAIEKILRDRLIPLFE